MITAKHAEYLREAVRSAKYLSVVLSCDLSWGLHIQEITAKARRNTLDHGYFYPSQPQGPSQGYQPRHKTYR